MGPFFFLLFFTRDFCTLGRQLKGKTHNTLYLLIVFLVEARTVALTLIKGRLNKTKVEKQSLLPDREDG